MRLDDAGSRLEAFAPGGLLTSRIARLESEFRGRRAKELEGALVAASIDSSLLEAVLALKHAAGQVNVMLHAVGVLWALPHVLHPDETIEYLSLGAGNTGRAFDLETDRQVAEFTFIQWRGGAEAVRHHKVFANLVTLALADTSKRRVMYVVGKDRPLAYMSGRGGIETALSRHAAPRALLGERFPEMKTVGEFFARVQVEVEVIDLADHVPLFRSNVVRRAVDSEANDVA